MFLLWFHCSGVLYKLHSNHSFCYCILLSLFISPADFTKAEVATTVACNSPRSSSFDGNVICMLNIYLMHIIRLSTFWYYSNYLNWNSRFLPPSNNLLSRKGEWGEALLSSDSFFLLIQIDTLLILLILVLSFSNIISNSTNTNSSSNNYVSSFY